MNLTSLVSLYRAASEKNIKEHLFSGEVSFSAGVDYLKAIWSPSNRFGRIESLSLDGLFLDAVKDIPDDGKTFKFSIVLPAMDACQFYRDLGALITVARSKISRGEIPSEYYICDEDLYTGDPHFSQPANLVKFCQLIEGLKYLALYHDEKSKGSFKLVFVQPSTDLINPPLVIEICVSPEIVEACAKLDIRTLEYLQNDMPSDHHYSAKVDVFTFALTTFLSGKAPANQVFEYLLKHWAEFLQVYQRDLSTYLSGFAFHKAKREVANAEMDVASKFSSLLTDIAGKALGIPLSMAALLALPQAESDLVSWTIVGGLFLAAIILFAVVWNQKRQFSLICDAKDIVLGSMEGKRESYPEDLQVALENAVNGLNTNQKFLGILLNGLLFLSFLPFVLSVILYLSIVPEYAEPESEQSREDSALSVESPTSSSEPSAIDEQQQAEVEQNTTGVSIEDLDH